MYLLGILCLVAATAALPVLPDPQTLPHSAAAAHQDSKIQTHIHNGANTSARIKDKKDSEKVKKDMMKITPMPFPPPPQLPPYDYSMLKKQKADQKQKHRDFVKPKAENYKKEKESVIPEKLLEVKIPPNPETLSVSKTGFQDFEVRANIPIVTSNSHPVADKQDNETVQHNMVKNLSNLIPSPPELPLLKKQTADKKHKFNDTTKQQAKKSQKEKEAVILDLSKSDRIKVPPNPATLINPVTVPQDSEARAIILSVATDSASVAGKNDDEEVKYNKVKIATVAIPPPPELPPFDYSNLRKHKSDKIPKSESTRQQAEKLKEKELTMLDLEKPVKVKVSPIPATLPFVTAPQKLDISANILGVTTDSTPADKKDNGKVKHNIVKIATVFKPPVSELAPIDYSILRKQEVKHNLKPEYSAKQAAKNEKKKMVILDLEKPVKVEEPSKPVTDSIAALPVSEVRMNTLNVATDVAEVDKKDNEEDKMNIGKITLDVIPPPPELPLLDFSNLQKQKSEQKQKPDYFLKQKADKSKKDKNVLIIQKPVEVKVVEPKFIQQSKLVRHSKSVVKSKPVEESKLKEELKKEPVKHSVDIPVNNKWTIPTAPRLSKLISNYPQLPSLGLNWPSQRPPNSRPPRIIYT